MGLKLPNGQDGATDNDNPILNNGCNILVHLQPS